MKSELPTVLVFPSFHVPALSVTHSVYRRKRNMSSVFTETSISRVSCTIIVLYSHLDPETIIIRVLCLLRSVIYSNEGYYLQA